jgi:hypothetical protein
LIVPTFETLLRLVTAGIEAGQDGLTAETSVPDKYQYRPRQGKKEPGNSVQPLAGLIERFDDGYGIKRGLRAQAS